MTDLHNFMPLMYKFGAKSLTLNGLTSQAWSNIYSDNQIL